MSLGISTTGKRLETIRSLTFAAPAKIGLVFQADSAVSLVSSPIGSRGIPTGDAWSSRRIARRSQTLSSNRSTSRKSIHSCILRSGGKVTFSFSIVTKRPLGKPKSLRTEINFSSAGQSSCNLRRETTNPKKRQVRMHSSASAKIPAALEKSQLASRVTNWRFPKRSPRMRSKSCSDQAASAALCEMTKSIFGDEAIARPCACIEFRPAARRCLERTERMDSRAVV